MLRTVASFLALLPMLMPPGMCICQFVPIENVSATPLAASPDRRGSVPHATDPRPDCNCNSCRHARAATVAPERGDGQPAWPPGGAPSAPGSGKHWPGCLAAMGDVPLATTVVPVAVQADVAATSFLTPVAAAVVSPDRVAPAPPPTASLPLFISHCALLI